MRSPGSAGLMLGILLAVASIAGAAAQSPFVAKPKVMGGKVSTVTSFQMRKPDNTGTILNCRGTCFATGRTFHWQCDVPLNTIGHCSLRCIPPPPEGRCLIE